MDVVTALKENGVYTGEFTVEVVEQNWDDDGRHTELLKTNGSGNYYFDDNDIFGWLHNPNYFSPRLADEFDDVVDRNGESAVGSPEGGFYWYGPYIRRDYTGGTFGDCCIMYDPNNGVGNPYATDEAYLLRTGFLEYYESEERGGSASGCPTRDEYHPETGAEGDAIQFFLRYVAGKPQFHYMYFQADGNIISWHSTYVTSYVSQNPSGIYSMEPGETGTFTVKFKNTGNTTWRNNPSLYPNDYVELKSSDGGSGLTASFLNWPYDASLGWLNYESPTTMSESSIGPGGTATFSFTGKVNGGTSPGLRLAYFRPNHSVNGGALLEDWGGMHYQVNVTASTAKLNDLGIPISFSLSQNYPNPFNPVTTISYTLPSATHARLDVFNILGQNVQTLVNKHQTAGEHTVLWNSEKFSSGIYLYRIQTGEKTETKKMILLK